MTFKELYDMIIKVKLDEYHSRDETRHKYAKISDKYGCEICDFKFPPYCFGYTFNIFKLKPTDEDSYVLNIRFNTNLIESDGVSQLALKLNLIYKDNVKRGHKVIEEKYTAYCYFDDEIPILNEKFPFPDISWFSRNNRYHYSYDPAKPEKYFKILFYHLFNVTDIILADDSEE
jgi:hypothetical protein